MNRILDNIKDEVAFDNGFVNWDDFKKSLSESPSSVTNDFEYVVNQVVSRYARTVENYYKEEDGTVTCTSCGHINIK